MEPRTNETKINSFTDLYAWKVGHKVVLEVYRLTKQFPKDELFALTNQMRRCVVSITSNIAEGFSRRSYKEKIQFYAISQGSVTELQNQLLIAKDVGYLKVDAYEKICLMLIEVHKMLNGLIRKSNSYVGVKALLPLFIILISLFLAVPQAHALSLRNTSNNLGLVGYWNFNDGTSTKATDFSGRGNTGTLTNMEAADWTTGKKATALAFDGVNEYVSVPNSSLWNFGANDFSVSLWIKLNSLSNYQTIIGNYYGAGDNGWVMQTNTGTGNLRFYQNGGGATLTSTSDLVAGSWYHFAMARASGTLTFYINGVSSGSASSAAINDSASILQINNGTNPLNGLIDEVRIYNRALSASEIYNTYNEGQALVRVRDNTGLVGYWSFEDATGTKATDFSGQGNTGTLTNGPTWAAGKRGKGVSFDGTNDYVTAGTAASTNLTSNLSIFAWMKATSPGRTSIATQTNGCGGYGALNGCFGIAIGGNTANRASAYIAPNWRQGNTAVNDGKWHHVGYTLDSSYNMQFYFDGATDSSLIANAAGFPSSGGPFVIGSDAIDANYYAGSLDEVRVYNRALTAQQVADLYNAGATTANPTIKTVSRNGLVGYWNLDDGTSTIATDFSGNGKTGTLTNGPTWVTGKRGKAVSFDGTDDYVAIGNRLGISGNSAITISAWIKPNSVSGTATVAGLIGGGGGGDAAMILAPSGSGSIGLWMNSCSEVTGAGAIKIGIWQHVVITKTPGAISSTTNIYVDGVSQSHSNQYGNCTPSIASDRTNIGAGWNATDVTQLFDGLIDEVRVYSRALSAEEIQLLYTIGK